MRLSGKWMAAAAVAWLGIAGVSAQDADLRLIEAVQGQDHEAVRALLEQKVDVDAREGDGATALHWAVLRDDAAVVEALLGAGADPDAANDYGVTALNLACTNRSAAVVGKLLDAGADAERGDLDGRDAADDVRGDRHRRSRWPRSSTTAPTSTPARSRTGRRR